MPPSDSDHQVFGLTAVDMAAASLYPASPPRTPAAPAPAPTSSALLDAPQIAASTIHFADLPPSTGFASPKAAAAAAAAAAATPSAAPPTSSRVSKAIAALPLPAASPPPPSTSIADRTVTVALTPSPSTATGELSAGRRLPPIAPVAADERTSVTLTTPGSRMVTPQLANSDQRNFDGRDLNELVKLSWQDYKDVARIQKILEVGLSSNTTESSTAEALLQIREASIQNPSFSVTPAILTMIREHLLSRNRLLRPAAAYALAGYAANSRYGRGLLTAKLGELLPRLNCMMKCKLDSMDARYAAMAVHASCLHSENKEAVGRSGSIPLLINLLRQNVGRSNPAPPLYADSMEILIGVYEGSERSSSSSSALSNWRPDTAESNVGTIATTTAGGGLRTHTHAPPSGPPPIFNFGVRQSYSPGLMAASSGAGFTSQSISLSAPLPSVGSSLMVPYPHSHPQQQPHVPPQQGPLSPFHMEPPSGIFRASAGSPAGRSYGGGGVGGHSLGGDLPTSPSRGAYVLHVRQAAAHAVAALVNLAALPTNRQRMRDAGIAHVFEDVLQSRNDNILKERCRLLIDLLHMDTNRFKETQAVANLTAMANVGQAVASFVQRGRDAKSKSPNTSLPGEHSATSLSGSGLESAHVSLPANESARMTTSTLGVIGSASLRGSLAYNLVRQLERGDLEGDRKAGSVTLKQRASVSRATSQAVIRATSTARKTPKASVVVAAAIAGSVVGSAGELSFTEPPLVMSSSGGLQASNSGAVAG